MKNHRLSLVPLFLFVAAGCGDPVPQADSEVATGSAATSTEASPTDHSAADHDHGHGEAQGEPMPMLAIMRQLSVDLAAFTHALWLEDFEQMSERSAAIANHPPIDPADVQRMQSILGAEWEGFEEADHEVHEASEELHHAVETRDLETILTRLDALQRGCVACHTKYRGPLLSEGSGVRR